MAHNFAGVLSFLGEWTAEEPISFNGIKWYLLLLKAGKALLLAGMSPLTLQWLFVKAAVCSSLFSCIQVDG